MRHLLLITAILAVLLLPGCTYYRIIDPATGNEYFTQKYEDAGGALRFHDARTGRLVTLPSSEVEHITEDQFKQAIYTPTDR